MKYHFSDLTLPPLPQLKASAMMKIASNCGEYNSAKCVEIPNFRSTNSTNIKRDIDCIIADLEANRVNNITHLEWIYCIYKKSSWDERNQDRSLSTSQTIWKVAESNSWLKGHLFWHLILYAGNNKQKSDRQTFPSSLVSSLDSCTTSNLKDQQIVIIARILTENKPATAIAQICYNQRVTPSQLFIKSNLPHRIPTVNEALAYVFDKFQSTSEYNISHLKWLLSCLKEMSLELQLASVEKLLTCISSDVGGLCPDLTNWLVKNYSSSVKSSRWKELTSNAKTALRKWIGAVHYGDFQHLVDILTKERQNVRCRS